MRRREALLSMLSGVAAAQTQNKTKQPEGPWTYTRTPDLENIRYGPHPRNVLDLWKAKSSGTTPILLYLHPGGFTHGDKTWIERYDRDLRELCLEHGISVASAGYRYSTDAPFPAPMADSARAVQFLRSKAHEWNLDPKAVALSGASSGAGIALWIAFHDDMADPKNADPVLHQSTRVSAAAVIDAQTSYDPRVMAKVVDEKTAQIEAIALLFGLPRGTDLLKAEDKFALYDEGSATHHLNAGDPPVFLYYTQPFRDLPPTPNVESIHNPRFGFYLRDLMSKLGIECIVKIAADYPDDRRRRMSVDMLAFLQKHLPHG
jgi:acetyl esterase/lipase